MTYLRIRSFQTAYLVLIISAIVAFTAGEVYSYYALNEQQGNYALIEITDRQRTNSFLINNQMLGTGGGVSQKLSVDSLINRLSTIHEALKSGNSTLNIPTMEELSLPYYDSLDIAFKAYLQAIQMLKKETNATNETFLIKSQAAFVAGVDKLVSTFKEDNDNDNKRFRDTSWVIHLSGVAILLVEFFFIFIPMIHRIQRHNVKLTDIAFNQSHIIRHPLTNIMGLLQLMDKSRLDEKDRKCIFLIERETKELDSVIRENVNALSKELGTD